MPLKTLLSAILLSICLSSHAQVTYTPTVDSLLNLIDTTSGVNLMYLYPKLHIALYEIDDVELQLKFNNDFTEAARAFKIEKAEALSYTLKVEALYNHWISDSLLLAESFKALDFMKDIPGTEVDYFFVAGVVGEVYLYAGNFEEALKIAGQYYEEARIKNNSSGIVISLQLMGAAYKQLGIPDKAKISFREAIEAADEETDKGLKADCYFDLVKLLNEIECYTEALEVNREFEAYLERIRARERELRVCYNDLYLGYAHSYAKTGQYDPAWEYLSQVEALPAFGFMRMYLIEEVRFILQFEEGKYDGAEQTLNRMEEIIENDKSLYQNKMKIRKARADLYYRRGEYHKAANLYNDYIVQNDSIQKIEMAERLHLIRTRYEIDKLEMQQEQERRYFRSTITWLIVVLILISILTLIIIGNVRNLKARNRILAEKAKQWAEATIPSSVSPGNTTPDEEDKEVAAKLYTYINETKIYKDPALTLDSLAEQMELSRSKVSRAINRTSAQNFKQYINEFRIREIIILMDDPDFHSSSLDELMELAGFNSRSTFYESFKKITGLTPAQYWKERKDILK